MKCRACGQELAEGSRVCPICKTEQQISLQKDEVFKEEIYNEIDSQITEIETSYPYEPRSRVVAGLLQIFLGGFGLGRFYLGYYKMAVGQLFTAPIFLIGTIWAFIDGILILCGQINEDANGIPLK